MISISILPSAQAGVMISDFGSNAMFDHSIALQSDGKIVAVGEYGCAAGSYNCTANGYKFALARFNTNGSIDATFGTKGIVTTNFNSMSDVPYDPNNELNNIAIQSNGKLVVGTDTFNGGTYHFLVARFNSNGSLDTSFGAAGQITTAFGNYDDHLHAVMLQRDGKILAAGSSSNGTNTGIALARYYGILPTSYISTGSYDGWILESKMDSGVGGTQNTYATTIYVGDDLKNRQYRSILSFNTAPIPDNAVITSALFKVRIQGVVGNDPFNTFGNLLADIHKGYFGNKIALELADFSAPASAGTVQQSISPITYNWYRVNLSTVNMALSIKPA
jgi:uncharacterized delta-60 repeat protein